MEVKGSDVVAKDGIELIVAFVIRLDRREQFCCKSAPPVLSISDASFSGLDCRDTEADSLSLWLNEKPAHSKGACWYADLMGDITLAESFDPPVLVIVVERGSPIVAGKVPTAGLLSSQEKTVFSEGIDIP